MFGKTQFRRTIAAALCLALSAFVLSRPAIALPAVKLAWNPNPEENVTGYRLRYGTVSGQLDQAIDVGSGALATVSGLRYSSTYYFAIQAYNSSGLSSEFTAEISVTTESPLDYYANWVEAGGLRGEDAAHAAVPHSDGVPNLVKYAFGLRADRSDRRSMQADTGTLGLPLFRLVSIGGLFYFEVQYVRLRDGELSYIPRISTDMINWSPMEGAESATTIDESWERVIHRMPVDPKTVPRLFGMVGVTVLVTPRAAFDRWVSASGLAETNALPGSNPMNDGVTNLVKYAFNIDALEQAAVMSEAGTSGLPGISVSHTNGRTVFRLEYLRRKNSGLVYSPEVSGDMIRFSPMRGTMATAGIDSEWERVAVSLDVGNTPSMFARVQVRLP